MVTLSHETNTLYFIFLARKPVIVRTNTILPLFLVLISLLCRCLGVVACVVRLGFVKCLVLLFGIGALVFSLFLFYEN